MNRLIAALIAIVLIGAGAYFTRDYWLPLFEGGTTQGAGPIEPASKPGEIVEPGKPYQEPEAVEFAFRRLEIETGSENPEACLYFTRDLDASGGTKYEDYLSFDPNASIAVRVQDRRLCIGGLAFNETYTLEMKQGLPAASGEKLAQGERIPVELRDRPGSIAFGSGFILPRESGDGVPITTINVNEIEIKVIRVGDRMLSQMQSDIVDQRAVYPYDIGRYEESEGALVWTGRMKTEGPRNQAVVTAFAIRKVLPQNRPGAYLVVAQDAAKADNPDEEDYWDERAAQWVVDSDMGITTFRGADGLSVFVRSLETASPDSGVKLALVARNNEILGEATTDGSGRANFAAGLVRGTGGNEPVVVMAYGADGDFAFLDLRRPAFDLTDRGVDGRAQPGRTDAYLYLERGIYRPGETVQLMTMLRDYQANALADMPLTVIVSRPDGSEFKRITVDRQTVGSVHTPFTLTATAPRGRWQAAAFADPEGAPIGRVAFDVQDFVPQRLKVTLNAKAEILHPGEPVEIGIESRFLYGAPAAGLSGEGEMTVASDSDPFPQYQGYRWGRVDEVFDSVISAIQVDATDAEGKSVASGMIESVADTSLPLKASIRVSLFEPGGRTTDEQVELPVRVRPVLIGIKPSFNDDTVPENSNAALEIIAVSEKGERIAVSGLTYEFVREDIDYHWYRTQEGEWRYERVVRDRIMSGGTFDVAADNPAKLAQDVQWGSYRLTVVDPASGASAAVRFWGGWGAGSSGDSPDKVMVTADKPVYRAGESAKIDIRPASDGKALVVVAGDRIYSSQLIDVSAGGASVSIPVSSDWGAGAYALVTVYKPLSSEARAPVRAIGLVWLGVDASERTLAVDIQAPERITPRQHIEIPVKVSGGRSGESLAITLAAVDEGILQLTDFVSPDPAGHYFGKRRLGLDMRDDYGRLIETGDMAVGELRTGGDGFGGRSLAVVPQKTIALFSGIVQVGSSGVASVPLDIPDFNGELRLMAVAFGPSSVGAASKPLTVRDAVVGEIVFPRFLAPGDRAEVALNLHNVDGDPGDYRAIIQASGAVGTEGEQSVLSRSLRVGERALLPVALLAKEAGIGTVTLTLEGPNGFKVERNWPIEVRPPQLSIATDETAQLMPGQELKLGANLIAGLVPGTESVSVSVSGAKSFDNVAAMLRWLDKYPYGCIEQTTSRAYPLVFYNDMAALAGMKEDEAIRMRVQDAVDRVLDMQQPSGGFGMWSSLGDEANPWIGVFAMDFLMAAKEKGYVVADEAIRRGLRWLHATAANESVNDTTRAYAFYMLARAGQASAGDLRYFYDTRAANVDTAIGAALAGGALVQVGDKARASRALARGQRLAMEGQIEFYNYIDYGSLLRDAAGVIAVSATSGDNSGMGGLVDKVSSLNPEINWTTTQEKAWMLIAAHAIEANAAPVNVGVTGVSAMSGGNKVRLAPASSELAAGVSIRNNGDKPVWRTITVDGVPVAPLPAESAGVTVTKRFLAMDGTPADTTKVTQNTRLIVLIEGSVGDNLHRTLAVLDLLPAGWEIEAAVVPNDDGTSLYGFLPVLTRTNIQEGRDDRYVAAFETGSYYRDPQAIDVKPHFAVAYIVRAITPGTYALPAANVEDMYAPRVRARTTMMQTQVVAAAQ